MNRKYIILLHTGFWVLLIISNFLPPYISNSYHSYRTERHSAILFFKYVGVSIGFISTSIVCFYGSYIFVAPLLMVRRQYVWAFITAVMVIFSTTVWRYFVEFKVFKPLLGFDNYMGQAVTLSYYITNAFGYYFPRFFVYGLMCFFVESWYTAKQRQEELRIEKVNAELTFLRSQINPHFLFNTINDIYSLTYQRSEMAPTALLKLSEILRYMLREGKEDKVLLQNEIKHLEHVVELQQISSKGTACINFTVKGYIGSQKIASLLLIAFVENAFKHGVLNDVQNPVLITIQADTNKIHISITNKKNRDEKDKTGGIGLVNVKRRLELLYPNDYSLAITNDNDFYSVNLILRTV